MAENRIPRDLETRQQEERPKQWQAPELLPEPDKQPGLDRKSTRLNSSH